MNSALNKLLLFLVICAVAALSLRKLSNYDFWQHMASGRYMAESGEILTRDVFSYTIRGKEWVNHQWLSQLLMYLGYRAVGAEGMVFLKALLFVITFTIILTIGFRKETCFLSAAIALLAALTASGRLMVRPEAFTLFLTSVYLAILFRNEYGGRDGDRTLYLLVPLQLLWANLHGGSIVGLGLIWIFIVGDFADSRIPGRFRERSAGGSRKERALLIVGLLAMGACFCNPSGWHLLLRPFQAFASPSFMSDIGEWSPTFSGPPETRGLAQSFYAVFLGIAAAAALLDLKRAGCSSLLLLAVFAYLSLKARRNMALFALVAAPITVRCLNDLFLPLFRRGGRPARFVRATASSMLMAACLLLLFAVSTDRYYVADNSSTRFGIGIHPRAYPRGGADFILENDIPGRVFNNYDLGSYLMWRFHPGRGVFVDGRNDLYGEEFMSAVHKRVLSEPLYWERVASDFGINCAIIRHHALEVKDLLRTLHSSKEWVPCYIDELCIVFLRDSAPLDDLVRRYRLDLENCDAAPARGGRADDEERPGVLADLLDRYPPKVEFPFGTLHTATFFTTIGLNDRAAEEYRKAAALQPGSAEIRNSLGIALNESGRHTGAEESFREALALEPDHAAARNNLALSLIKQGRCAEAEEELMLLVSQRPGYALAHNSLGICYDTQGRRLEARAAWMRALELDPFFRPARVLLEGTRYPGAMRALPGHGETNERSARWRAREAGKR